MRYRVVFSTLCKQKLKEIALYIAQDNPTRAMSFIDDMQVYCEQRLAMLPFSGKEIRTHIRMLPFKRYNIFYQVHQLEKKVFVLDIFAGNQDWDSQL